MSAPTTTTTLANGVNVDQLVATITAIKATPQGIRVEALSFRLEGDIDLHGFLGLSGQVRPGYQGIRLSYQVKSDAPREKIEALCEYVQRTSPVLDIIRNPVPVTISLE